MSAVKHQQSTPLNPMQQFYGTPTPENAVLLAMADHRAHCDPMQPQSEFMTALRKAHERLAAYQKLVEALRELHAIDERKLAASTKRVYKIGHSVIEKRVLRNRALLRDLGEAQ